MNLRGLNSQTYRNLKLRATGSYWYAAGFHSLSLAMRENENQYLEGERWREGYIPAVIRAFRFRLAGEQVLIDESVSHFAVSTIADGTQAQPWPVRSRNRDARKGGVV